MRPLVVGQCTLGHVKVQDTAWDWHIYTIDPLSTKETACVHLISVSFLLCVIRLDAFRAQTS